MLVLLRGSFIILGIPAKGKRRPLRVRIGNGSAVFYLLSCSKNLRYTDFSMVFIEPDRSREERAEHTKLVQQLKRKRTEFPGQRFYIKNNKVLSADP